MNQNMQQMAQMMKTIKNPQQAVNQFMQNNSNPVFNKLINMANSGDEEGLKNFARNMYKEKGLDFDQEYQNFQSMISQFK